MSTEDPVLEEFRRHARLGDDPTPVDVVEAIRRLPYGRPSRRTVEAAVSEWRASCSMKHALLARYVDARFPEIGAHLVHRVYRLVPDVAAGTFGASIAGHVPPEGIVDVHTYAVLVVEGRRIQVDVTFPGPAWDGRSDMPLACADGDDVDASKDPWEQKDDLVRRHCDPLLREPFLAALAALDRRPEGSGRARGRPNDGRPGGPLHSSP